MSDEATVVMRGPEDAHHATWAMGSLFEHLLLPEESGGRLGVATVTQPPGIATPLHRHTHEAEAFFLLEGEMTYRAGEETLRADRPVASSTSRRASRTPSGSTATPRCATSRSPSRATCSGSTTRWACPPTALRVPREGEGRSMDEEIARWNEVGPRYGLEVVGPPIPEAARS